MRYDVAIIGGGPSGLRVAHLCASAGLETLVIEEHPSIGWPVQCAGVISFRTLEMAGVSQKCVLNRLRGAEIIAPSVKMDFDAPDVRALVIDRRLFDRHLARTAIRSGAELLLRRRAILSGESIRLRPGNITIDADVVVAADGPTSSSRRALGIRSPEITAASLQMEVMDWRGPDDRVVILLDQNLVPGFFAWAVPLDEGVRIGCACVMRSRSRPDISAVLARYRDIGYIGSNSALTITGGVIPLSQVNHICKGKVVLVGDAAGQVKPLSGGGLYPLMVAADLAAEVIISHIDDETPLQTYSYRWHRTLGKEISAIGKMRRGYVRLSNDEIDALIARLSSADLIDLIVKYGDIDHPMRLLGPIMRRSPSLFAYVLKLRLVSMIRSFMKEDKLRCFSF